MLKRDYYHYIHSPDSIDWHNLPSHSFLALRDMPDLQLKGADADRTVNPQSTDDATDSGFDALIDLLASDDIHDIAGADSHPSRSPHAVQLRDASGKLAFDKIRLMFATQNLGPDRIDHKLPDTQDTHNLRAQPHGSDIQDVCVLTPQDFTVNGHIRYLAEAVYPGPCRRQANLLNGGCRDHAQPQSVLPHHRIKLYRVRACRHSTPHLQLAHHTLPPQTSWVALNPTSKFCHLGTSQMLKLRSEILCPMIKYRYFIGYVIHASDAEPQIHNSRVVLQRKSRRDPQKLHRSWNLHLYTRCVGYSLLSCLILILSLCGLIG